MKNALSGIRQASVFAADNTVVRLRRLHADTEIAVQDLLENDQDTDLAYYFTGYRSMARFIDPNIADNAVVQGWMETDAQVEAVAVGAQAVVQWYEPTYVRVKERMVAEANRLMPMVAELMRESPPPRHRIYSSRNALEHLAWLDKGWTDTNADGVPDGYTANSLTNLAFAEGDPASPSVLTAGASGPASLSVRLRLPVENVLWTLSVGVDQFATGAAQGLKLTALDKDAQVLAAQETVVTETGRKRVDLYAPPGTFYLDVEPITFDGATTGDAQITLPALRVDGSDQFGVR